MCDGFVPLAQESGSAERKGAGARSARAECAEALGQARDGHEPPESGTRSVCGKGRRCFCSYADDLPHNRPFLTDAPTFQATEVMEEFEKMIAQLKLELLNAEHQRHQQVQVRFP